MNSKNIISKNNNNKDNTNNGFKSIKIIINVLKNIIKIKINKISNIKE